MEKSKATNEQKRRRQNKFSPTAFMSFYVYISGLLNLARRRLRRRRHRRQFVFCSALIN
jgi:hypothetical protein